MSEPDLSAEPSLSGVRGHAVVLADTSRFAIWQVSPTGQPGGAYVESRDVLERDTARGRAILSTLERRALVSMNAATSTATATDLAEVTGLELGTGWFDGAAFDLGAMWVAIAAARREYQEAAGGRLDWRVEFGDTPPTTLHEFADVAHVRVRHSDPLIGETLMTSDLLHWLVAQWTETETVRARRKPLRDAFGPPATLPSTWLEALRSAYTKVLPL